MEHPNVFKAEFHYDASDPAGYGSGMARVGEAAGGQENVVKLFELPGGQNLCPYHYEYVEEWLIVLDGSVDVRTPTGSETVARGGIVCFPAGPAGAHKVSNPSEGTARVLMFSSGREPAVAVYPDSDKIGVWAGEDKLRLRRADGDVDYWDGEPLD